MSNRIKLIIILSLIFSLEAYCQDELDVTDQTLKIAGFKEEELWFGFASGDKVIFNFKEIESKELKEVEIIEYPNNSRFSDFNTSKIENKVLNVIKTGVYVFRFKNSSIKGRVCKIRIQRVPKNNQFINFNTAVTWVEKQDTTIKSYTQDVVVGYDTTYRQKKRKVLSKTEIKEELIVDKSQRVHSMTNDNGNKTSVYFTLPQNEISLYKIKSVIAWAYWIGVDEAGNKAWEQNVKAMSNLAKEITALYSPLGALAVGAVSELIVPSIGEDVSYYIVNQQNRDLFLNGQPFRIYDEGKGIAGYRKFTDLSLLQGDYFICLSNDNYMLGVDASIKVIAIVETNYYEDKLFNEQVIKQRIEKKIFNEPIITTKRVPITGQ